MKILDNIVRLIVGALFIFSGLIKLNDPIGTQIKLEEYFEVFAVDFAGFFVYLMPAALTIAMLLIVLEVVLGIAVLLNYQMQKTTKVLLLLITFFTFLTFYSAYFDKVTDCGCFGDAIPLTPWESFTKDLILVVLIGYLFARRRVQQVIINKRWAAYILAGATGLSFMFGIIAIRHLPFIDFRPYAIGDNIPANMIPAEQPVFAYVFIKDGKEVKSATYLSADDGYEYASVEVVNLDKTIAKITDYNIWNEEEGDFTQRSFEGVKMFFISYDILDASLKNIEETTKLIAQIEPYVTTIGLTSSVGKDFEEFRHEQQLAIPYFFADATVLKAMIRSNPGMILVKDGTVLGKWHYNDVPEKEEVLNLLVN